MELKFTAHDHSEIKLEEVPSGVRLTITKQNDSGAKTSAPISTLLSDHDLSTLIKGMEMVVR